MFEELSPSGPARTSRARRSACSNDSRCRRAEPVKTPPPPTYGGTSSIPWSLSRNSRTWLECADPRDLVRYRIRLRSPSTSMLRSSNQVSISDEISSSVSSASLDVCAVYTVVISRPFRKSMRRISPELHVVRGTGAQQAADGVDGHHRRIELHDQVPERLQVQFDAVQGGPGREEAEHARPDPRLQVDPDTAHVADDLGLRLLMRHVDGPLTTLAGRLDEPRRDGGLAGPRVPVTSIAVPRYTPPPSSSSIWSTPVEMRSVGAPRVQSDRRDGLDDDAVGPDVERILVGPVERAPVLGHPEAAGGDPSLDPLGQHHHAVRDVLLDPDPGQLAVATLLGGDDDGDARPTCTTRTARPSSVRHRRRDRRATRRGRRRCPGPGGWLRRCGRPRRSGSAGPPGRSRPPPPGVGPGAPPR